MKETKQHKIAGSHNNPIKKELVNALGSFGDGTICVPFHLEGIGEVHVSIRGFEYEDGSGTKYNIHGAVMQGIHVVGSYKGFYNEADRLSEDGCGFLIF